MPHRFLRAAQRHERVSQVVARIGVVRPALEDLAIALDRVVEHIALLGGQGQIVADLERIRRESQGLAVMMQSAIVSAQALH